MVKKIFLKEAKKVKAKNLKATLANDTIRKMYQGYASVPTGNDYYTELKTQSRNLSSPKFGDLVAGNDDELDQLFKYVFEFPEYINDLGNRTLIIDIELNLTNNEAILEKFEFEPRPDLVAQPHNKTWYEAEEDCVRQGGHLPSVTSDDENKQVGKSTIDWYKWIGGRRDNDNHWTWSDRSEWNYTNWDQGKEQPNTECFCRIT